MIISYNWLSEYLPVKMEPEKLSIILTAIGLEVENLHKFETIKGGLKGLVTAEIVACEKHPDADKLKITKVNTGTDVLQVVCGAPNAAVGQKVILAKAGTTIYPLNGEPLTLKKVKIRGAESNGMICAEDEIGLGKGHEGILVLPPQTIVGIPAADIFDLQEDFIFEIGLTPNRIDAMSHLGVARDICAWISHHEKKGTTAILPYKNIFTSTGQAGPISVLIENLQDCQRYSGVSISNITVGDSPKWLQLKLQSIGIKSISNIVDITNFILHETGQPLHAFDADKITGSTVIVKNPAEGTLFTTLDEKVRKLSANDLLICNAAAPMCIAGVYGGAESGVTPATKNIFLESAWFKPDSIRKTSLLHGLRTDAATRFEKGVDISNTLIVLKRAADLILEICGGEIKGDAIDVYPNPAAQAAVGLKYHYLKKLSGKNYHAETIKNILSALGFTIFKEGIDEIWVNVPFSKPDITIPADIVEEIMRIDGLDNIDIPSSISISPSNDTFSESNMLKEKMATQLTGLGFNEIFTNSITNSAYYTSATLKNAVRMMNNLSAELDILRPSLLHTGLEVIAYNINRKNGDLLLFENGKSYYKSDKEKFEEKKHLCLYASGYVKKAGWNKKAENADYYFLKAVCEKILATASEHEISFELTENENFQWAVLLKIQKKIIGIIGTVSPATLLQFGIKQPVVYADIYWDELIALRKNKKFFITEVSKYPSVQRDLALVLDKNIAYSQLKEMVAGLKIPQLQYIKLFDIFESEKLGTDKKSMAVSFGFMDNTKTLTDKEIDAIMQNIIAASEKNLEAEIRK